jgi:type II secretory pathway component PulF
MPVFVYKALQTDGTSVEGELEASGRLEALRQIDGRGLRPIRIAEQNGASGRATKSVAPRSASRASAKDKEKAPAGKPAPTTNTKESKDAGAGSLPALFRGKGRVTPRMLENFTRLLSSLLAAGVPLSRALTILQKEAMEPVAREQWKQIHDLVVDGLPLAEAMARSPQTFPKVYVAMVEAGEAGGFLDVVLAQIADFQAREKEMKGKVMTALLYPLILLGLAVVVLAGLLTFFIPRFQAIFKSFGGELPLVTQLIVNTSELLRSYGLFVIAALFIAGYQLRSWFLSEAGRRQWEGMILKAPALGPLVAQFAMTRFCRMLGTLLGAGVPLINGLNVARRSIGNQILVDAVADSIDRVKEGKQLGPSLKECRTLFAGSTIEMISVAEESGKLDSELVRLASVTEGDLDRQLKATVALVEPLMLFVIAAVVGLIFIGMALPIFSLQDHIK